MTLKIKKISSNKQKLAMRELQLICLPADTPITCSPKGCAMAVYDEETMVAFALARQSVGYQKTMYLARVGVHPDYRGRGLQKKLIELREGWARKKGFTHSITDTTNESVASMRSLLAAGYRPFWPQLVKPWALKESVYWKKKL